MTSESLFLQWLVENGARFPKVKWPVDCDGVRGAIALETIASKETMIEIPSCCLISEDRCYQCPILGSIFTDHPQLFQRDDHILSVYIMRERLLGEDSFFAPYLRTLPQPNVPVTWTDAELDELQHADFIACVKDRQIHITKIYNKIFTVLVEMYPDLFSWTLYPLSEFEFAWNSIQSRSFGRRLPWTALVPFADALNHNNLSTKYEYGNSDVNSDEKGMFRLFPSGGNSYKAGMEIFNSYGRKSNLYLLLDYGFVLQDNMWDTLTLNVHRQFTPDSTQLINEAQDESRSILIAHRLYLKYSFQLCHQKCLSKKLLALFRILALSDNEREECTAQTDLYTVFSLGNEKKAVKMLMENLEFLLFSQFPTTFEEDAILLENLQKGDDRNRMNQITAIQYRMAVKDVVQRNLSLLRNIHVYLEKDTLSDNNIASTTTSAMDDVQTQLYNAHVLAMTQCSQKNSSNASQYIRTTDDSMYN